MSQTTMTVKGMTCQHCAGTVESSLKAVDGVSRVTVDLKAETVQVVFDENRTSLDKLMAAVREAGYEPSAAA